MEHQVMSLETRKARLEQAIAKYVRQGYRVVSRTDTTAQLIKPKEFGCMLVLLTFFTLGLALILYWLQKDPAVYLAVDELGRISARKSS